MSIVQTKQCQNCKQNFIIEPDDFDFYEKIKVPPPSRCPECRLIRRAVFRNYNNFYKRKCDLCGCSIISNYSTNTPYKIYCVKCWWSDGWDPFDYEQKIDFSRNFFEQFSDFEKRVPAISLMNDDGIGSINCRYTYDFAEGKNCYLVFSCWRVEDSFNCCHTNYVKQLADSLHTHNSELCYETIHCNRCYNCRFTYCSQDSHDCHFVYNLKNCSHCFLSSNLRNKKYFVFNKPYSKEEYEKILKQYELDTFHGQRKAKEQFNKLILEAIRRSSRNIRCTNSFGDNLRNCKNLYYGFIFNDVVDSKFLFFGDTAENSYDILFSAKVKLCYEGITIDKSHLARFAILSWNCSDIHYSNHCHSSSHLFACVGLRNKQYCILNKQYSKEEYEALVPKIISHMNDMPYTDKKGRVYKYGEFFPTELSPFAYNETIAQEYFPLTKQQAQEQGYLWKDPEPRNYQITIKSQDLPDNIKDVEDSILKEIIGCAHQGRCNEQCTEAFRIIPQELAFYRRMNLPLPRLCPNCRHYQRLKQRNPLKLWKRQCMAPGCPNTFETSYAPDRPEIVYCEACYLKEVV